VEVGPVPCTIQRATQFHEFAWMVVGWTRQGDRAVVPPLTVQPVAAADVGELLATIAVGPPQARSAPDFAGPQVLQLDDMARRTMEALGDPVQIESSWDGPFGGGMTGDRLLPGPGARIGPTTFEAWLTKLREAST
ncbi:MAG: NmrA family transcriptional regulator, partial [Actinomycetota bacterium]